MKKFYGYLFLCLSVLWVYGCGESIYESAGDRTAKEAQQDALDFDFINGNYGKIVDYYNSIDNTAKSLNDRETYMFLNSLLGLGGFNVLNGLDAFANNQNGSASPDVYSSAGAMIGISNISKEELKVKTSIFNQAVVICDNKGIHSNGVFSISDENIATLCKFTGLIGTTMNVSGIISNLTTNNSLEISQQGFQNALSNVNISQNIDSILTQEALDLMTATVNCALIQNDKLNGVIGNTSSMIDEYKTQLMDNNKVSKEKLKNLILSFQTNK